MKNMSHIDNECSDYVYSDYRYEAQQLNEYCNQSKEDYSEIYTKILKNKRKYFQQKMLEKTIVNNVFER